MPREQYKELAILIGRRLREACAEDTKRELPPPIAEKLDELREAEEQRPAGVNGAAAGGGLAQVGQPMSDATL